MTDTLSPTERGERMSRIHGKDTKPEILVRRLIHSMGYRYRLHAKDLPGHPDLVFRSRKKAILVHGCFWHQHQECRQYRMPKTKTDFWIPKLEANKRRDSANQAKLLEMGWSLLILWECQLKDLETLAKRIKDFLEEGNA